MSGCAFIIPYFGKIPDYFDLWKRSAALNPDYTFFLYTDLPFDVPDTGNVIVRKMSFEELRDKIQEKFDFGIKLNTPYKLCDYRPAYGYIFENDISDFDFWGFCDLDLILGDMNSFITTEMLQQYDKLFANGHMCMIKNTHRNNRLFLEKYRSVLDYRYAFTTDYNCHFDENGTIAYAQEYETDIRVYYQYVFYDPSIHEYRFMHDGKECAVRWDRGRLQLLNEKGEELKEILYVHLQKRKMHIDFTGSPDCFYIRRTEFYVPEATERILPDTADETGNAREQSFFKNRELSRKKEIITNLKNGALRFRIYRKLYSWRSW